jgi:hypothetical protein
MLPRARKHQLIVQPVASDVIVYDRARLRVHRLNQTTALVWEHCDGHTSVADLAARLAKQLGVPADERLVWMALRQLDRARLLTEHVQLPSEQVPISRRQAIALGITGAAALLLPSCDSVTTPNFGVLSDLAPGVAQQGRCKEGGCKGEKVKGECVCKPTAEGCGKRKGESDDCRCFVIPSSIGLCTCDCLPPDDVCDPTITVIGTIAGLDEVKQGRSANYQVRGFAGNCGTCQHVRCTRKVTCEWEVSDKTLARVNGLPDCNAQFVALKPGNVALTATLTLACTGKNLACAASTSQPITKAVQINV